MASKNHPEVTFSSQAASAEEVLKYQDVHLIDMQKDCPELTGVNKPQNVSKNIP